jgi:hypothetical protein
MLVACSLAGANLWFAAVRSTIPLKFEWRVVEKRRLAEKHPGFDDVYLLNLGPRGWVQVDEAVYSAVEEGDRIRKQAWSRTLEIENRSIDLEWSRDVAGMLRVMPGVLLVILATFAAMQLGRRSAARCDPSPSPSQALDAIVLDP